MKERPILMSAPMVRAILDGSKTQTRRVVKDLKGYENTGYDFCIGMNDGELQALTAGDHGWEATGVRCPYGQPGDRLWVRESWRVNHVALDCVSVFYKAHERHSYTEMCEQIPIAAVNTPVKAAMSWRPSIHMPRWASRITLEITGIRVERLQDITNNDALAEGTPDLRTKENNWDMVRCYQELWEQINGAGSWALNPWVWVVEFKRLA